MECSTYEIVVRFLKEIGFPAAVAGYLLFRFDGLIRKNTDALHGLRRALQEYGVGVRGGAAGSIPPSRG